MSLPSRTCITALIALWLAISGGCHSVTPRVNVLAVKQVPDAKPAKARPARRANSSQTLLVFLEIVNPTGLALQLSRLEYRFNAESWFSTDGEVALSHAVDADSAAVVEVPVHIEAAALQHDEDGNVVYSLEGRLFARDGRVEHSWAVEVRGTLNQEELSGMGQGMGPRLRVHMARQE